MRLRCAVCLWLFCGLYLAAAADTVRPPAEELQITCRGCNEVSRLPDSLSLYVFAGTEVRLIGEVPGGGRGEWTDINGNLIAEKDWIGFFAYSDADFVFRGGGQNRTVHVVVDKRQLCQPRFESKIEIIGDDKDLEWFAPGKTFEARIDVSNVDCDYGLTWSTDDPQALVIKNPHSSRADIEVKAAPASGRSPILKVTLSNAAGTVDSEEKKTNIEEAGKPELELTVYVKTDKSSSSIIASCKGSSVLSEDGKIETFRAQLYYFDGNRFVYLGQRESGGGNISFDASRGEGGYQVTARIKDEYGGWSENVTKTVKVVSAPQEVPNVYVKSDFAYCFAGVACIIDAAETSQRNRNATVRFYDDKGNKFSCDGDVCRIIYEDRGEYKVYVRAYYFGEEDRGYKSREVTVLVV